MRERAGICGTSAWAVGEELETGGGLEAVSKAGGKFAGVGDEELVVLSVITTLSASTALDRLVRF